MQSNCAGCAIIFFLSVFFLGPTRGELQRNPPKITNGCHSPKRVVASLKTIANKLCRLYYHFLSWVFFSSMKTQRDRRSRSCLFSCPLDKPVGTIYRKIVDFRSISKLWQKFPKNLVQNKLQPDAPLKRRFFQIFDQNRGGI